MIPIAIAKEVAAIDEVMTAIQDNTCFNFIVHQTSATLGTDHRIILTNDVAAGEYVD